MKANLPKSYLNLPKREKEAIDDLVASEVDRMLTEEEVVLFAQYTKMMCIVLHDYFGFEMLDNVLSDEEKSNETRELF